MSFKIFQPLLTSRSFCTKSSSHIIYNEINNCGILQLNRPRSLNAINGEMFKNLNLLLNDAQTKNKLVIFKGNNHVVSSGGDIKELSSFDFETAKDFFKYPLRLFHLVHNLKIPYIAFMNGVSFGAASNLTVAARKYRIATESTDFAMPEAKIGFINDNGSSYFLSRLPKNVGFYIGLASPRIKAYDIVKIGLADYYIQNSSIPEVEEALINSKNDEHIEQILKKFSAPPPTETQLDSSLDKIEKCFSGESVEKIVENLHSDGSDWAMETLQSMNSNSPMSLKLCHKEITLGKSLSLEDCLKLEYRLAVRHFNSKSDFYKGVRALLVDRKKPQWRFETLGEIGKDEVDEYFKPISDELSL